MNLLIIGKNSVLCRLFIANTRIKHLQICSRNEIKKIDFNNFTHVMNFSFNPKLKKLGYNEKLDFDLRLSKIVAKYKIIYILISTRFVYSGINNKYTETAQRTINPKNIYGKNKLIIENKIRKIIPKNHLILRLSTILYFNMDYKRKLFSYTMLSSLKKFKKIYFDFNKNTYKDFILPSYFAKCLDKLILNNSRGTYNLCSGVKIKVKKIAEKVVKGFKSGKIIFKEIIKADQSFSMSNKLIFAKTGILLSLKEIYDYCVNMGIKMKNE
jgi:dTDP-4-dehydrorhamnose reductase